MVLRHRVDQLLNEHRLADAGAAEQADLAAARIGREQVDHLDAGDEHLRFGGLIGEGGRFLMDGTAAFGLHRAGFIDWLADDVDDAAQGAFADRHGDRRTGIADVLSAHQTFGSIHRHGAHGGFTQMLRHFQDQAVAAVLGFQRVHDLRQMAAVKLHVHHGAHHLRDVADSVAFRHRIHGLLLQRFRARDDFDQFLGDHRLTRAVVLQRQLVDHVARIARGGIHGAHFGAEFAGDVLQ